MLPILNAQDYTKSVSAFDHLRKDWIHSENIDLVEDDLFEDVLETAGILWRAQLRSQDMLPLIRTVHAASKHMTSNPHTCQPKSLPPFLLANLRRQIMLKSPENDAMRAMLLVCLEQVNNAKELHAMEIYLTYVHHMLDLLDTLYHENDACGLPKNEDVIDTPVC
jgi:hypothetical protein